MPGIHCFADRRLPAWQRLVTACAPTGPSPYRLQHPPGSHIQVGQTRSCCLAGGRMTRSVIMDFEKYTERSRGFVQATQGLALRRGHQRLTPEHLLTTLLEDKEGL